MIAYSLRRFTGRLTALGFSCLCGALLVTTSLATHVAAQAVFRGLGEINSPGAFLFNEATGVSDDGTIAFGFIGDNAFRWTSSGSVALGELTPTANPFVRTSVRGVSQNGQSAAGSGQSRSGSTEAFLWTIGRGFQSLGLPDDAELTEARGISGDGQVVVGYGEFDFATEAFRWSEANGFTRLGYLDPDGEYSEANAASHDGAVVVGVSTSELGDEAFRWTEDEGITALGDLAGGSVSSSALDVSPDGTITVGFGTGASGQEATRWNLSGSPEGLGYVPGGSRSTARAVSADGAVIVGGDFVGTIPVASIWTPEQGMELLTEFLTRNWNLGSELQGWRLIEATDVSSDGKTIVGRGLSPAGSLQGWIATNAVPVPEPSSLTLTMCLVGLVLAWRPWVGR